MDVRKTKERIIEAGRKAVDQLIKVAKEEIKNGDGGDLSAEKLKNAAATKKLAVFDAFEILERIEKEQEMLDSVKKGPSRTETKEGFAERRAK
jgi:ASC-1-like (ASCH) protein